MGVRVPGVGPVSFKPACDPVGTAVLVPGRGYTAQAPLLFFSTFALLQHGWRVQQHWWDPPAEESDRTVDWVSGEVAAALPADGRTLVVGKSLGTLATPLAARRRLPAIWLTPVLGEPEVVAGIAANPAPQLLLGGSADPIWVREVARSLVSDTCTVVEIPHVDHAMMCPGDVLAGIDAHREVVRAIDNWLPAAIV
jgi:predicted alpha/beta-hydrolase family hydrolase